MSLNTVALPSNKIKIHTKPSELPNNCAVYILIKGVFIRRNGMLEWNGIKTVVMECACADRIVLQQPRARPEGTASNRIVLEATEAKSDILSQRNRYY